MRRIAAFLVASALASPAFAGTLLTLGAGPSGAPVVVGDTCGGVSTGLKFHLDASNASTIKCDTSGSGTPGTCDSTNTNVMTWNDTATSNAGTAAYPSHNPTFNPNGVATGKPSVVFGAGSQSVTWASSIDLLTAGSYTIITVEKKQTGDNYNWASGSAQQYITETYASKIYTVNYGGANTGGVSNTITTGVFKIFTLENAGASKIYQSNTDVTASSTNNYAFGDWSNINWTGTWLMETAEACFFSPALSSTDRTTVYNALNTKWGGGL